MPPDVLPAGCFLGFEIYEMDDGSSSLKFYWWGPTRPNGELKMHTLNRTGSLLSLYKGGVMIPVAPHGCQIDQLCPLKHVEELFSSWTAQTGTYHKLCKLPPFQPFRRSEQWHDPSDPPAPTNRPLQPALLFQHVSVDQSSLTLIPFFFCLFAVVARLFSFREKARLPV